MMTGVGSGSIGGADAGRDGGGGGGDGVTDGGGGGSSVKIIAAKDGVSRRVGGSKRF